MSSRVDLGFLEECNTERLHSRWFPSKAGGKPAWLALENLPTEDDLICSSCNNPTIFLAQIYAPDEQKDFAFHRTLFVFICRNKKCANQEVKVFRNQLHRNNKYYPVSPPEENEENFELAKFTSLCSVCGCYGSKKCAKCHSINYCSKNHQLIDWKNEHREKCGIEICKSDKASETVLFKEYEIIIEPEEIEKQTDKSEEEKLKELEHLVDEKNVNTLAEVDENELTNYTSEVEDKVFLKFKKRIEYYPEQIIRYQRHGSPLYVSNDIPASIPLCEYCGSKRSFEFQILPQVIYELEDDNIDFGTLIIYTCTESCEKEGITYLKEFVFKQQIK